MRVAVLHHEVSPEDPPAEQDVLVQVESVVRALRHLGHEPITIPCTLDLSAARDRLGQIGPDVVFNLVESLGGSDWLALLATALLDALGLPYSGSSTEAMFLTTHKLLAKQRLCQAGLPTPAWAAPHFDGARGPELGSCGQTFPLEAPCIIKTVCQHASFGLEEESVVRQGDATQVRDRLQECIARLGRLCFAEQYVEGREFNLALLDGPEGPEVLPPAEIDFSTFPPGKPRIVGYRAKWAEGSFEYGNTPQRFDFQACDQPLLEQLHDIARRCWSLFGLRGYARVDFRVDAQRQPWVLEINANPCLSPDAGFTAALDRASISFAQAVQRILDQASAVPRP